MVHSDFKRFLVEAGQRLSIEAVYVFTEEGGEIESTDDIFHADELWISSGEPFIEPVAEIPKVVVPQPKTNVPSSPSPSEHKVDRAAEYRKHEAMILQLQQLFPSMSLSELLTSAMLSNYSLDRTIDMLLTQPPVPVIEEFDPFLDFPSDPKPSASPFPSPPPPKSNVPKIKVKVFINGEAEKDGVDNGQEISYEEGVPLETFVELAGKILNLKGAKRVFTLEGGEITDMSEIFPGDELCISCGEPWRPTEEEEDEPPAKGKGGKVSESVVKELSSILPQFPLEKIRSTLEKFNGDMDRAMMFLLEE